MPYTFELSFTGLCIFTFSPDPFAPTEVNVLLVNGPGGGHGAHHHLPYLSYQPRDLDGNAKPAHTLVPGPDGTQIALQDLAGETKIEIEDPTGSALQPVWRDRTTHPNLDETPSLTDESQTKWLDWAMALQRVNPETSNPDSTPPYTGLTPFKDPRLLVTGRVKLTNGKLQAANFLRRDSFDAATNQFKYARWDFKSEHTPSVGLHALAGRVILIIDGIPDSSKVRIKGQPLDVFLRAPLRPDNTVEPLVRASITNLPAAEDTPSKTLHHFAHFYDLVTFTTSPTELRLPVLHDSTITSTGVFCPPTTHVKAG